MTFSCQGSLVQGAALSQRFREPGIDSSYLVSPLIPTPELRCNTAPSLSVLPL